MTIYFLKFRFSKIDFPIYTKATLINCFVRSVFRGLLSSLFQWVLFVRSIVLPSLFFLFLDALNSKFLVRTSPHAGPPPHLFPLGTCNLQASLFCISAILPKRVRFAPCATSFQKELFFLFPFKTVSFSYVSSSPLLLISEAPACASVRRSCVRFLFFPPSYYIRILHTSTHPEFLFFFSISHWLPLADTCPNGLRLCPLTPES